MIIIKKSNYKKYGSKGQLMRDLSRNVAEKMMTQKGLRSIVLPVSELRHLIESDVVRTFGSDIKNNIELSNALSGGADSIRGEIIVTGDKGKRIACFSNMEIIHALDVAVANQTSRTKTLGHIFPRSKAA